jgi:hypothetical protein
MFLFSCILIIAGCAPTTYCAMNIIERYFSTQLSRADCERMRFELQKKRIAAQVDIFFKRASRHHIKISKEKSKTNKAYDQDNDVVFPDDGSRAFDAYRKMPCHFPTRIWAIIASYVHDTIPLTFFWNNCTYQVNVPRSLPDTGIYRWDVRQAVGCTIGVPQFLIKGIYCRKSYKPIELLGSPLIYRKTIEWSDDHAIQWKHRTEEEYVSQKIQRLWREEQQPHTYNNEHQQAQESIELDKDTADFIALSVHGCPQRRVCKQTAFLYTMKHEDVIIFCTEGKEFCNLFKVLKSAHEKHYQASLSVEFLCKDCSKTFHPEWLMVDLFPYPEHEASSPFDVQYCGCYKKNRSWPRSVLARIINA